MEDEPGRGTDGGIVLVAAIVWFVLGSAWAMTQFGISEVFNQISIRTQDDETAESLLEVSDFIAWPAGRFYESRQITLERAALERILAVEGLSEEKRTEVREHLARIETGEFENDSEEGTERYELLDEFDESAEVPVYEEYAIYGGTCLAWGASIAVLGFLVTIPFLGRKQDSSPR